MGEQTWMLEMRNGRRLKRVRERINLQKSSGQDFADVQIRFSAMTDEETRCCVVPRPSLPRPPCGACGGQRTFEFQVMPQLLSELKLGSDTCEVGGVDWGSLHVYTCDQSCHVTEGYVAEYVQLQQFELSNIPGT